MAEAVGRGFKSRLLSFLPVEIPQDVTLINDKNHLRSSVPCLQTSLYRSPIAGAKFTDLSLHITPYKEEKRPSSNKQPKFCHLDNRHFDPFHAIF